MILENCSYLRDARASKEAHALRDSGFDVSVISPERVNLPSRLVINDVTIYGFPLLSFPCHTLGYLMEYTYAMVAIMGITIFLWFTNGFDIIHVANPPDCIVPAMALYKLLGKRIIYDQHDVSPELYAARFVCPSRVLLATQHCLERLSYKISDRIIVTNESYKAIAIGRGNQPDSKITLVRNGPELCRSNMLKPIPNIRVDAAYVIVFAGVTGYQDGVDYLLQALACLRNDHKREDFLCLIVGDGAALSDARDLVGDLGLEERVRFCGWVSDVETYLGYLASADICVSPEPSNGYNDKSTFVKVMEYMLAGKPIVAFDLPETRYTAQDAAIYVKPNDCSQFADALATLMEDEGLRRYMGSAGRQRIETKLAWEYSVPALLDAYDEVVRLGPIWGRNSV